WLAAWLGIAPLRAGGTRGKTSFKGAVLDYALRPGQAPVLLGTSGVLRSPDLGPGRARGGGTLVGFGGAGRPLRGLRSVGVEDFLAGAKPAPVRPVGVDELACMTLTSGTTGPSKFVMSPWGLLWFGGTGAMPIGDVGADDCFASPLP